MLSMLRRCALAFLAGASMTSALQARPLSDPTDAPLSPKAVRHEHHWAPGSVVARVPNPFRSAVPGLMTWEEAAALGELRTERQTGFAFRPPPRIALAWAKKAPAMAVDKVVVRARPVFSLVEPAPSSVALPPGLASLRWLSGSLDGPRALFFFDAPPAVRLAAIQPVPEASTWVLMLAGLAVVGLAARRRYGR